MNGAGAATIDVRGMWRRRRKIAADALRRDHPNFAAYVIKLVNDGAPTTKHSGGCVTFTLTLVDPRTNREIALAPQKPKYVFPIAAFFAKETKSTIRAAFAPLYAELAALQTTGITINGVNVPIKFLHGNDLSNLRKGTDGCGVAMGGSVHHPCTFCSVRSDNATCGQPGECGACVAAKGAAPTTALWFPWASWIRTRPKCHHFDISTPSGVVARLTSQRDTLLRALRLRTEHGCEFDANVRFPSPHKEAARAEITRRGETYRDAESHFTLDDRLDAMIEEEEVTLADGLDTPQEVVAAFDLVEVQRQLALHKHPFLATESEVDLRSKLTQRLVDLALLMEYELNLQYPGVLPSSLYSDATHNTCCVLHFEMRAGERLIYELFSFPLKRGYPDAKARIAAAEAALRANTSWAHFELTWSDDKSVLEPFSLTRAHAKEIVHVLEEHVLPHLVKASDAAIVQVGAGGELDARSPLTAWRVALNEYVGAVNVMRYLPGKTDAKVILGSDGYAGQIRMDADRLQYHADRCTDALIFLCGSRVITNFFYTLRAGHFREMMINHGYLAYLSNDAVEHINAVVNVLYHRHSQHAGSQGKMRKDGTQGQRQASPTDAIRGWAERKIGWASGMIQRAFASYYCEEAEAARRTRDTTKAREAYKENGRRDDHDERKERKRRKKEATPKVVERRGNFSLGFHDDASPTSVTTSAALAAAGGSSATSP